MNPEIVKVLNAIAKLPPHANTILCPEEHVTLMKKILLVFGYSMHKCEAHFHLLNSDDTEQDNAFVVFAKDITALLTTGLVFIEQGSVINHTAAGKILGYSVFQQGPRPPYICIRDDDMPALEEVPVFPTAVESRAKALEHGNVIIRDAMDAIETRIENAVGVGNMSCEFKMVLADRAYDIVCKRLEEHGYAITKREDGSTKISWGTINIPV